MQLRNLLFLCLLIIAQPLWAARTLDLYSEEAVLATNARQQDQSEAVAQALNRVLVRVSGRPDIGEDEAVQGALDEAGNYLSTYRFENSDVTLTNVLGESVSAKRMIMEFDRGAVEALLVRNRLPVWGDKRPETLIWLADRLDGTEHILADNGGSEFGRVLREEARKRGVPVILPIMDLDDTLKVSFADIYGLFTTDMEEASERYQPDATLVGRLSNDGGQLQADFVYLLHDDRQRYRVTADTKAGLARAFIDQVTSRLAEQYAVVLNPALAGQLSLRVDGVQDLATLAAVEEYLNSLNLIPRATLRQVQPKSIQFDLEISGDRTQLRDMLALDDRLVAVEESRLDSQLDNELVYRWVAR